jgi:nucleotidyltransferase/DNA polymerase involved in DNA repair
MPTVRAERLCPNAVFLPPDFPRYRVVSSQAREIFNRHTDLIEPLSLDEAYLDVSENKTGLPTATQVARTIREQIRSELSLTASAGVAPNKFIAKIASDWKKPDGLFVIQPEEIDSFLLPLPVDRLPGVGKVTEEKLKQLEVQTIADLRRMDLATLESRLGRYGVRLYELARGIDNSKVVPDRPTQSISAEDTFEQRCLADRDGADDPKTCGAHMGCLAQGIANRAHRCTETENQRIQDSHSQPHRRFSTCFLRGVDEHCPGTARTGRARPRPEIPLGRCWRQQLP